MNIGVHFSSETVEWETPRALFDELDSVFNFQLDVCATNQNHKVSPYFTKADDGLRQRWTTSNWMNPPYGREIYYWIKKAHENPLTVCLLPARTDTRWFHEFIYNNPKAELRFLKGRLKFGGCANSAPFPSMIVIFR
jgi:phage N-6-adenine-methyltransferase